MSQEDFFVTELLLLLGLSILIYQMAVWGLNVWIYHSMISDRCPFCSCCC